MELKLLVVIHLQLMLLPLRMYIELNGTNTLSSTTTSELDGCIQRRFINLWRWYIKY